MTTTPVDTGAAKIASAAPQLTLFVALVGALAGVLIAVLTEVVSRSQIGGEGWSLRGNGALVLPLAMTPAILAGGWAGLARWSARDRRWGVTALAAGGAALIAAGLIAFGPVIVVAALGEDALSGGSGALTALALTFLLPLGLAFADGLVLSFAFAKLRRYGVLLSIALLVTSAALIMAVPGLFFVFGPLVLVPLLVSLPLVVSGAPARGTPVSRPLLDGRWLAGICTVYTLATGAGIYAAQQIQAV